MFSRSSVRDAKSHFMASLSRFGGRAAISERLSGYLSSSWSLSNE